MSEEPQRKQWWCPDCQRVLRRPPSVRYPAGAGTLPKRYHSHHCKRPMRPVIVLGLVSGTTPEDPNEH